MFFHDKKALAQCTLDLGNSQALISAIEQNVATIAFTPAGEIIAANPRFLALMGFAPDDIIGRHHRLLCPEHYSQSLEYADFWQALRARKTQRGRFLRQSKQGNAVWLEASYFPVLNAQGELDYIYKIATDVTADQEHLNHLNYLGTALDQSLARVEFTIQGEILTANDNFLHLLGYSLDRVIGQHHRLFCDEAFYHQNPNFWQELAQGKYTQGRFKRRTAQGKWVWLEASYNPIIDDQGRVTRIIKFASDITAQINKADSIAEAAQLASENASNTAQIAHTSAQLVSQSLRVSEQIVAQVGQSNDLLQQLNQQSKNISAIVSTIRGIAEQTNLLALNAAIEAARAGEQGRGFAVVADEVRQLAGRTSQSTLEIQQVVGANEALTNQVTEGMGSVKTSAQASYQQLTEVAQVIAQIQDSAEAVAKTVSALF
ncbi:MAG: PAS domain-containing methyl-accepting chemotaxis protein [Marinagarivorans sp.]